MARFVTPAKVALLLLTELYCTDVLPEDSLLPVLRFVASHVTNNHTLPPTTTASQWSRAERAMELVAGIGAFEMLLSPYQAALSLPAGRSLWDSFLVCLWDIDSLDALHAFFDRLLVIVEPRTRLMEEEEEQLARMALVRLSRASLVGRFVRRCQAEFARLPFDAAAELWKAFVRYREPTAAYIRRHNAMFGSFSFDNVLLTGEEEWGEEGADGLATATYGTAEAPGEAPGESGGEDEAFFVSRHDAKTMLDYLIEQVQKYGARVPPPIRDRFVALLDDAYMVPSESHYLDFLDAWRCGESNTAFDSLHRYFDYTMQNDDRSFYQYALMNLAVLQASFGCHADALSTMLDTIVTARENHDAQCLNFSLHWLFHFTSAHPRLVGRIDPGSHARITAARETITYLAVKARQAHMWPLLSAVMLTEARLALLTAGNGSPSGVGIAGMGGIAGVGGVGGLGGFDVGGIDTAAGDGSMATAVEYVVRSSHVLVVRNVTAMFGAQLAVQAAVWERLGLGGWSATTFRVFIACHARTALLDDRTRISCRMALSLAMGGHYPDALRLLSRTRRVPPPAPPPSPSSSRSSSRSPSSSRSSSRSSSPTRSPPSSLPPLPPVRPWKPAQLEQKYLYVISLQQRLRHNDLGAAEPLLSQLLQNKGDTTTGTEPDLVYLIDMLDIEYMGRRGDYSGALAKTEALLAGLGDDGRADKDGRAGGRDLHEDDKNMEEDEDADKNKYEDDKNMDEDEDADDKNKYEDDKNKYEDDKNKDDNKNKYKDSDKDSDNDEALYPDAVTRARLLLLKASLYDGCGHPQRGFTVAVRAAGLSLRLRLVPTLWEAVGAVANVLTASGEFAAAAALLCAVLPRALEADVAIVSGRLFSLLADAQMGLVGWAAPQSAERAEGLSRALDLVRAATEYYAAAEDTDKQREMNAKHAVIVRLGGRQPPFSLHDLDRMSMDLA